MINTKLLLQYALDSGFHAACVIDSHHVMKILHQYKNEYNYDISEIRNQFKTYFQTDPFSSDFSSTFLMCGFSYYTDKPDGLDHLNIDRGAIAPFAQQNYYAESVERLKEVEKKIRIFTGAAGKQGRIFCNSKIPEKILAWAGGLGNYGKNSLIINKSLGSYFVISGLYLPFRLKDSHDLFVPARPGTVCGTCRACIDACPTHAIKASGHIDQSLCIQALLTSLTILPDNIKKAFKNRIYGCQTCQEVCPYNKKLTIKTDIKRGDLGPGILLRSILEKAPHELKKTLKKTVLGASWIDKKTIQRNALLAAGNLKNRSLLPAIKKYYRSSHPALHDAAAWAIKMIQN